MRVRPGSWVTMGPDPYLATCQRCGQHIANPPLPTPLDAFVKYLRYAIAAHKLCKEPAE